MGGQQAAGTLSRLPREEASHLGLTVAVLIALVEAWEAEANCVIGSGLGFCFGASDYHPRPALGLGPHCETHHHSALALQAHCHQAEFTRRR